MYSLMHFTDTIKISTKHENFMLLNEVVCHGNKNESEIFSTFAEHEF